MIINDGKRMSEEVRKLTLRHVPGGSNIDNRTLNQDSLSMLEFKPGYHLNVIHVTNVSPHSVKNG